MPPCGSSDPGRPPAHLYLRGVGLLPKDLEIALGLRLLGLLQAVYETTGGRFGSRLGRLRLLLLRTRGRRSGLLRTVELLYIEEGRSLVVVGSKGGSDTPPAWLVNLRADPDCEVQVGSRARRARAWIAGPEERERLWRRVNEVWDYEAYQRRCSREIPIVILEPVPD